MQNFTIIQHRTTIYKRYYRGEGNGEEVKKGEWLAVAMYKVKSKPGNLEFPSIFCQL